MLSPVRLVLYVYCGSIGEYWAVKGPLPDLQLVEPSGIVPLKGKPGTLDDMFGTVGLCLQPQIVTRHTVQEEIQLS